jgi:hypothetical protein
MGLEVPGLAVLDTHALRILDEKNPANHVILPFSVGTFPTRTLIFSELPVQSVRGRLCEPPSSVGNDKRQVAVPSNGPDNRSHEITTQ